MSPEYIRYKDMVAVLDNSITDIGKSITTLRSSMGFLAGNPLSRPLKEFTDEMLSLKVELDIKENLLREVQDIRSQLTAKSFINFAGLNLTNAN